MFTEAPFSKQWSTFTECSFYSSNACEHLLHLRLAESTSVCGVEVSGEHTHTHIHTHTHTHTHARSRTPLMAELRVLWVSEREPDTVNHEQLGRGNRGECCPCKVTQDTHTHTHTHS